MSTHDGRSYDQAVGARVRTLRHHYRVKQAHLATRLGVDVATISRYERGERAMTVGTLLRIADQFNVSASTLLPPAHQCGVTAEPPPPVPIASPDDTALFAQLPQLEAGAIRSIMQVLAVRPDLIVPIMMVIEQHITDSTAESA